MPQLTDIQLVLLSAASQCAHGVIPIGERLSGKAASRLGLTLISRGLAQEQVIAPPLKGWRTDPNGQGLRLIVTPAGLQAIGVGYADSSTGAEPDQTTVDCEATESPWGRPQEAEPGKTGSGRPGTRKAVVLALLVRAEGATMADITGATGWLPHTVRAFLTGLRKTAPEHLNRSILMRVIAYRMQARVFGDLDAAPIRTLETIVRDHDRQRKAMAPVAHGTAHARRDSQLCLNQS